MTATRIIKLMLNKYMLKTLNADLPTASRILMKNAQLHSGPLSEMN